MPLLYLLGHPRGFVNCSRSPPGTSKPPGKGLQPSGGLRPVSGSTSPAAAPHTLLKAARALAQTHGPEGGKPFVEFICIYSGLCFTWSPQPLPASPGICAGSCSGVVFTCLLIRRCLKPFRGAGAVGVHRNLCGRGRGGQRLSGTICKRGFFLPVIRSPPGCPGTRPAALSSS